MISGATQVIHCVNSLIKADYALIVVDGDTTAFERGFSNGG
jgi:translation elongation factor EF-1alpha